MKLFLLLLSVLVSFSCAKLPAKYVNDSSVEYTNHPKTNLTTVVRHVYIDPSFKSDTKNAIEAGLDEWNIVLNGYEKFVVPSNFKPKDEDMSPFDFTIVNITRVDAEEMMVPDGVLGWVDDLGDPTVHIVEYRMVDEDVKTLLMHELGHSLGLPHLAVRGTLMYPYYPNSPCIDETTVRELVTVHKGAYSLEHMNWCNFKVN